MSAANKAKGSTDSSFHKGMVGDAAFITFAASQSWNIYKGFNGHEPIDYVVDTGDALLKVEVKRLESVQISANNYYYCVVTKFDSKRFDFMFVSTPEADYWIPASECPKDTLSIKQIGDEYQRSITRPGKYEVFRVGC